MNFLTSNKSISITVIASLILLGFFYIAGATKKTPVPDGNLPPITKTDGVYNAFQGAQSQDAIYLELNLNNGVAKLKSTSLYDNKTTEETGKYIDNQSEFTLTLDTKDGKPLESEKVLKFANDNTTLKLTNSAEAKFGLGGLTFYKPTKTLVNTSWNWEKSEYANDTKIEPRDKTKFKLTFKTDSSFESSTDCNSLSGDYYVAGNELKLGSMMSTLAFCEGSLEAEYINDLEEIYTYMLEEGRLILTLPIDSGNMQFVKAQN
jgi:heat shock protein HslJ